MTSYFNQLLYQYMPSWVTAADYISVSLQYSWHIPLQGSTMKSLVRSEIGLRSCDKKIMGNFSHTLVVL